MWSSTLARKAASGLVAEVEVALHGEVRRIDLEQVPAPDDERVFRLQLPRQREEVVAVRRVVGVVHDGQHAAGRGRGHEGLGEALLLPGERVLRRPRTPRARRRRRGRSAPRRPLGARSRCVSVPPGWCGRPRGRPPRRAGISENPADRCGSSYRRSRSCAAPGRSNSRRGACSPSPPMSMPLSSWLATTCRVRARIAASELSRVDWFAVLLPDQQRA